MPNALLIIPHFFDSGHRDSLQSLVLSVAECNFKVRVLTTWCEDNEPPFIHKNVEILQPFKRWNLFEIPSILRVLHGFRADVVHFVMKPENLPGKAVPLALPGMVQNFGKPGFILQLQGPLPDQQPLALRYWLQMSQAVVVEDDFTKLKVSALSESHRNQQYHVLQSAWHDMQSMDFHWASQCFDRFIYACGPLRSLTQMTDSLSALQPFFKTAPGHGVVFHLSPEISHYHQSQELHQLLRQKHLQKQVLVLKSVDAQSHRQLIHSCSLVSLLHLPLGSKDIPTSLKMAWESGKQVVVQDSVKEFERSMSDLWKRAVSPEGLSELLDLDQNPAPAKTPEILDSIGNQMSRIYQSVLGQ